MIKFLTYITIDFFFTSTIDGRRSVRELRHALALYHRHLHAFVVTFGHIFFYRRRFSSYFSSFWSYLLRLLFIMFFTIAVGFRRIFRRFGHIFFDCCSSCSLLSPSALVVFFVVLVISSSTVVRHALYYRRRLWSYFSSFWSYLLRLLFVMLFTIAVGFGRIFRRFGHIFFDCCSSCSLLSPSALVVFF